MDTKYVYGDSSFYSQINQSKIDEEVLKILEVLKKEKQTYCINKLVLNKALDALEHVSLL